MWVFLAVLQVAEINAILLTCLQVLSCQVLNVARVLDLQLCMGLYWHLLCSVRVSGLVFAGSLIPRLLHYPPNVFSLMIHYLLFFLYVIKFVYTQITPCASSLKSIQQCSPRKRLAKVSEQSPEQLSNCVTLNCERPEHEGNAVLPLAAAEPLWFCLLK